jgi:phospholipid-binding lipoprotein MlaA
MLSLHNLRSPALNIAAALSLSLLLSACGNPQQTQENAIVTPAKELNATAPAAGEDDYADEINDPIEGFNRAMFQFNYAVDRVILRPTVWVYKTVVPEFARTGISNVLDNWYEPVNTVNALLQGKFTVAANSFWRFVINSSLGILGFADVAGEAGLHQQKEDFGQTLGSWGVGSGPYLVLPIIGPSSVRDGSGMLVDIFTDPSTYLMTERDLWWRAGVRGFDARYRMDHLLDEIYQSVDPYATMRSLYTQRRAALVAE